MNTQEVIKLKANLEDIFRQFHANCVQGDNIYEGQLTFEHVRGRKVHIPPTARAKIDSLAAHCITTHPVVAVPPYKETKTIKEQAGSLESAATALLHLLNSQSPTPPWREVGKDALRVGLGVHKGPLPEFSLTDPPKRRRGERAEKLAQRTRAWEMRKRGRLPIVAYPIPALSVMFDPDNWPPRYVIEVTKRRGSWIRERFPGVQISENTKEITWLEYWSEEERHYIVMDGQAVLPVNSRENLYGFIPYTMASSGRGRVSANVDERFVGLLLPAETTLVAQARLRTAAEDTLVNSVYGLTFVHAPAEPTQIRWPAGGAGIAVLPENFEDPKEWPRPPVPPDLWRELLVLERDIDQFLGPSNLQGVRTPGTTSGYQEATLIGQGRLEIQSLMDSLNYAGGRFLTNVFRLIEVMGEPIEVWGPVFSEGVYRTISPKDTGNFVAYVSFEPAPPEEADRRALLGLQLWTNKSISHKFFLEKYLKMANASREINEILMEEAMRDPLMRQMLLRETAKDWELPEEFQTMLAASQAGLPGPTGGQRGGSSMQTMQEKASPQLQRLQMSAGELQSPPERGAL